MTGRCWQQIRLSRRKVVVFVHCEWNAFAVAAFQSNHAADWAEGAKIGSIGEKYTKFTMGTQYGARPPRWLHPWQKQW